MCFLSTFYVHCETEEEKAKEYLDRANTEGADMKNKFVSGDWNYVTDVNDDNLKKKVSTQTVH